MKVALGLAIALETVGIIGVWSCLALEIMYQADIFFICATFSSGAIATGSIVFAKICKHKL